VRLIRHTGPHAPDAEQLALHASSYDIFRNEYFRKE